MKKLSCFILFVGVLMSCNEQEVSCDKGKGAAFRVEDQEGQAFFDSRFDTYVVRHHVAGTIDSFRTFIICNPTEELEKDGTRKIMFSGEAQPLKERYEPNTLIAGEEFFVIFLDKVKPAGTE